LIVSETIPKIDVPKPEYKVKKGDDITIEVKFTATPAPTDEWSVSGKVVPKSRRVSKIFGVCINFQVAPYSINRQKFTLNSIDSF